MNMFTNNQITSFINALGELSESSILLIVCNVKNVTEGTANYNTFSIDTEFLNSDETQELLNMAELQGIPFNIFYDEQSFIKFCLQEVNFDKIKSKIIVYNSAQNGIGAGRKALIPSFCNLMGLKCTGSDPYRVCLCRDKLNINKVLSFSGISVPSTFIYDKSLVLDHNKSYIAKPIYESASIGISLDNVFLGNNMPFDYFDFLQKELKQPLIIQEFISGYEIEIPLIVSKRINSVFVFDPVCLSLPSKNIMGDNILDYDRIYSDEYSFLDFPLKYNKLPLMQTAFEVSKVLGITGLCRVDFRMQQNGSYYVTDVSTNPHFISHSSVNYAFKRLGLSDKDIFKAILLSV